MRTIVRVSSRAALTWVICRNSAAAAARGGSVNQPDQTGKAPGLRRTAIGEETWIVEGAEITAIHCVNATGGQTNTRQLVDISQKFAHIDAGLECRRGLRMLSNKGLTHLTAYFEGLRTNRCPQPDQHLICRHCQLIQGSVKPPGSEAAPASMSCRNTGAGSITEQHRQAVGGHYCAGDTWLFRPTGVGFKYQSRVGLNHRNTMHLLQPGGLAAEQADQSPTVFQHGLWFVANMLAKVAAIERRNTDTTTAGRDAGFDSCWRGPLWCYPIVHP